MRYTIQKENEVKQMANDGYKLDYIAAKTGLPKKVIWSWCPELRPHDDIIKQSVKQRYHFIFPDFEAKITTAFSPFIKESISDDEWEDVNNVVYTTLFDLAEYVFRNAITDLPQFSDVKRLCDEPFIQYCKNFWNYETSEYIAEVNKDEEIIGKTYADSCLNKIHFWSFLKKKAVKDITKGDLQLMQEKLVEKDLSSNYIYSILRVGVIPLQYAYRQGLTLSNVNDFQLPRRCRQNRISDELAQKIFSEKWDNELAYYANILAYYGHLKWNELKALNVGSIIDGVGTLPDDDSPITNELKPSIKVLCILVDDEIEANNHPREFSIPENIYRDLVYYVMENNYYYEDLIFDNGRKRNTWNDELKKQASKYTDREINFSMWH